MKRRLSILFVSLSLFACLALSAVWLRSGFVADQFGSDNGSRLFTISSGAGLLHFDRMTYNPPSAPREGRWGLTGQARSGRSWPVFHWQWLPSTDLTTRTLSGTVVTRHLTTVPYWIPTLITSLLPAMSLRRWIADHLQTRRRRKAGLCPNCGYDLRASKDRCPECGTPVPAQPANSSGRA
jgi:hypothetical protein